MTILTHEQSRVICHREDRNATQLKDTCYYTYQDSIERNALGIIFITS